MDDEARGNTMTKEEEKHRYLLIKVLIRMGFKKSTWKTWYMQMYGDGT